MLMGTTKNDRSFLFSGSGVGQNAFALNMSSTSIERPTSQPGNMRKTFLTP